jgi:hypothetical protein
MLDRLLDAKRLSVPRNKRRAVMQALGYDWHSKLPEGRVHDVVAPDNGKPKLFVRDHHLALNFTTASEVAQAYAKAQMDAAAASVAATLAR